MSTRLLAGPALSAPVGQLTKASSITATFHTTAPDELGFTYSNLDVPTSRETAALHREAALLVPLAADLHLLWGPARIPLSSYRIGRVDDQFLATGHVRTFTAASTVGLLDRRIFHTEPSAAFTAVPQESIVKALVDHTQALAGGSLGIDTTKLPATGVNATRTVAGRAVIGAELRALAAGGAPAAGQPGFDFDISPGWAGRTLQLWAPYRGADRGVVLEWFGGSRPRGTMLQSLTRGFDPSSFANGIGVSGGSLTTTQAYVATNPSTGQSQIYTNQVTTPVPPTYLDAPDVATAATGRYESTLSYPDIKTGTELATTAAGQLAALRTVEPTWTAVLRKNSWAGPSHIWKGDLITIRVRSGPVAEEIRLRVTDLQLTIDPDGAESMSLTLGTPAPSFIDALVSSASRLATLERQA